MCFPHFLWNFMYIPSVMINYRSSLIFLSRLTHFYKSYGPLCKICSLQLGGKEVIFPESSFNMIISVFVEVVLIYMSFLCWWIVVRMWYIHSLWYRVYGIEWCIIKFADTPHFTMEPRDAIITMGNTAYFSCRAEGKASYKISWLHNE